MNSRLRLSGPGGAAALKIEYKENILSAREYIQFQRKMEWPADMEAVVERALRNSLYTISAMADGQLIGMGRLVGDAAMYWYMQDIFVQTEYQGLGVGTEIVKRLIRYARDNSVSGSSISVCLMSARGKEGFYERFGFQARPNEWGGPGMELEMDI